MLIVFSLFCVLLPSKTTTIKILTGDVIPTQGSAYIAGYNIATYPRQVRRLMGYCPQFDALHEAMTAREALRFYGKIRGIAPTKMDKMVNFLLNRLSLMQYADRPCGTYSGGNKRKLSVAIALIGNPPVVFLDEPSTGMDPVSRRFMWSVHSLSRAEKQGNNATIRNSAAFSGPSHTLAHASCFSFFADLGTSFLRRWLVAP